MINRLFGNENWYYPCIQLTNYNSTSTFLSYDYKPDAYLAPVLYKEHLPNPVADLTVLTDCVPHLVGVAEEVGPRESGVGE